MKVFIPVALAPAVLSGCALNTHTPPEPAQQFVTTLIQAQNTIIQKAQSELAQASRVRLSTPYLLPPSGKATTDKKSEHPAKTPELTGQAARYLAATPASAGNAQTLRQALQRIAPSGWHFNFSQEIKPDAHTPLQWVGNAPWPSVLESLLRQQKLTALINGQTRQISIANKTSILTPGTTTSQVPEAKTVATIPIKTMSTDHNPFSKTLPSTTVPMKTHASEELPKPSIRPTVWRIEAGSTLKDTLFNWTASERCSTPGIANWTVAWLTTVNYRIDAPLQFEGSFREALNSLFILYGTAKVPLYAGVRNAQCVVSVDDQEVH